MAEEEIIDTEEEMIEAEENEELDESLDELEESEPIDEPDEDDEDDEVVVTIGDEETPSSKDDEAPGWVKELRKSHRETQRENKELRKKLEALENPEKEKISVGSKPKLNDFDTDEEYEQALDHWYTQKRLADEQEEMARLEQEEQENAWKSTLSAYEEKKKGLKVRDFEDAEESAKQLFDITQQGIIIQGAENPALVMYALGKNEAKAQELAEIKDPVKFAFTVSKLESQMKIKGRKTPPPPEKKISQKGSSGAVDSTLDKLRAEARESGDFSKVAAYRRKAARSS